jgi:Ca-activated chloride channel family protein
VSAANGVDPNQPTAELEVPSPEVLVQVLDAWAEQRKEARVLLVLDVSGSMGELAGSGDTKLDLAKEAAITALDDFKSTDDVGLWVFTTDLFGTPDPNYSVLVPVSEIGEQGGALEDAISGQFPQNGTPLFHVASAAYAEMLGDYDPTKINAIVFLTDGVNDDGDISDDDQQFTDLINQLQAGSEGATSRPVRVFTISYGDDADTVTLKAIAQATAAAHYDASNPATINRVFTAVISNF